MLYQTSSDIFRLGLFYGYSGPVIRNLHLGIVPENFLQKTKCLKHLLKLYVGSLQNTGKTNLHFSEYMFNEKRLFCVYIRQ